MQLLTEEEIKALVEGVWSGRYDQTQLPYWLFNKLANGYETAAVAGWGGELSKGFAVDVELERALQENIYYFAAHKTAHELKDMHEVYLASKGKFEFVQNALKVNDRYNRAWYETEYNMTTRLARSGREWRNIEGTKDIFPKLRFVAVQDGNTRDSHAALHGVVKPVDDPFWQMYFPPLDWQCRCRAERLQEGEDTDLSSIDMPPVEEQFRERVADSKKIWNESHPYFSGLPKGTQVAVNAMVQKKIAQVTKQQPVKKARFTTLQQVSQHLVDNNICTSASLPAKLTVKEAEQFVDYLEEAKRKYDFKPFTLDYRVYRNANAKANGYGITMNSAAFNKPGSHIYDNKVTKWPGYVNGVIENAKKGMAIYEETYRTSGNLMYKRYAAKYKQQLDEFEELARYARHGVKLTPESAKLETIIHEFGHLLHDQRCGSIAMGFRRTQEGMNFDTKLRTIYRRYVKEKTDIYSVSAYATENHHEFLAEVFVMYEREPHMLNQELRELIDEFNKLPCK